MSVNNIELCELIKSRSRCRFKLSFQRGFLEKYRRNEYFYVEVDKRLNDLPKIKAEFNNVQYQIESNDPENILQHVDFRERFIQLYHTIHREFREIQQKLKTAEDSTSQQGNGKLNQSQQIESPTRSRGILHNHVFSI